jgi:hypothetical protein
LQARNRGPELVSEAKAERDHLPGLAFIVRIALAPVGAVAALALPHPPLVSAGRSRSRFRSCTVEKDEMVHCPLCPFLLTLVPLLLIL